MKSGKYKKMTFIAEKSLEIEHTHEVLMILKEWPQKPLRKTVKSSGWFYKIVWIHSEDTSQFHPAPILDPSQK